MALRPASVKTALVQPSHRVYQLRQNVTPRYLGVGSTDQGRAGMGKGAGPMNVSTLNAAPNQDNSAELVPFKTVCWRLHIHYNTGYKLRREDRFLLEVLSSATGSSADADGLRTPRPPRDSMTAIEQYRRTRRRSTRSAPDRPGRPRQRASMASARYPPDSDSTRSPATWSLDRPLGQTPRPERPPPAAHSSPADATSPNALASTTGMTRPGMVRAARWARRPDLARMWDDDDNYPYAARVLVYRKDRAHPANGTVKWVEFAQTDKNGDLLPAVEADAVPHARQKPPNRSPCGEGSPRSRRR